MGGVPDEGDGSRVKWKEGKGRVKTIYSSSREHAGRAAAVLCALCMRGVSLGSRPRLVFGFGFGFGDVCCRTGWSIFVMA